MWIGAATWAVAAGLAVQGEDDRVVDDGAPNGAENSGRQHLVDLEASFDRSVFDPRVQGGGIHYVQPPPRPPGDAASSEIARDAESPIVAKVRAFAEPQFQQIAAMVDLSESQARKLRLALESDVRQGADEIDLQRQKYVGVVLNAQWGQRDRQQQKLQEQFQKDVRQCRDRVRQICRDGSFVVKSLPATLDADQHARLTAGVDGRLDRFWRSVVARQMLRFDASLGLDQRQHEALEALLVETRPAVQHSFGTALHLLPYADALIQLAVQEIGIERLRTILSERQAQVLWGFSRQAASQRRYLESQGVLQKKVD